MGAWTARRRRAVHGASGVRSASRRRRRGCRRRDSSRCRSGGRFFFLCGERRRDDRLRRRRRGRCSRCSRCSRGGFASSLVGLEQRLELLSQHHIAPNLQLASHERLHGIQRAIKQPDEIVVRQSQGAVSLGLCGALRHRTRAALQVHGPLASHSGVLGDVPLEDGADLLDNIRGEGRLELRKDARRFKLRCSLSTRKREQELSSFQRIINFKRLRNSFSEWACASTYRSGRNDLQQRF